MSVSKTARKIPDTERGRLRVRARARPTPPEQTLKQLPTESELSSEVATQETDVHTEGAGFRPAAPVSPGDRGGTIPTNYVTIARKYDYNDVVTDDKKLKPDDFMSYKDRLKPRDVFLLAFEAMAEGKELHIPAPLMPTLAIPEDTRRVLAEMVGDKLAGVPPVRAADILPPPDNAPALYRDRPRDARTGRQEGADKFGSREYARWIINGVLTIPRDDLKRLDRDFELAIVQWFVNHKDKEPPFHLLESPYEEPPYTAEQVRRSRVVARWADRHPEEIKGR